MFESSVAKSYAIQNSIPEKDIFIEENSHTTQSNIFYAAQIVKDRNYDKIIIVSDPLHMKRSIMIAKDMGLNVFSSPTKTTRFISLKSKIGFAIRELFFYIGYKIYTNIGILYACLFIMMYYYKRQRIA
jgi:uncharacterized SAM-binding protein YcdF (DUF218 family)